MESSDLSHSNATAWQRWVVLGGLVGVLSLSGCGSSWKGSIGAVLARDNRDGRVFVREAPPEMAAARAGIRMGDEILAIEGAPIQRMSPDEVHRALSGQVGTRVKISILRAGARSEISVERGPMKEEL